MVDFSILIGYTMMGLEYGEMCYCGGEADNSTRYGLCSNTGCTCDYKCPGNDEEICGGNYAISMYYISK